MGKSGLLAGFGHEHRIRAHGFSGTIVYYPVAAERSHVAISIATDSLLVVPESDSADIPSITRTMRTETLRVDSFPEIRFESRRVTPMSGGLHVSGDFTLKRVTRPVDVDLTLKLAGDSLRAEGGFVIRQSDFGIRPYRKALGMVKVKDEVRIELSVVATRVSRL